MTKELKKAATKKEVEQAVQKAQQEMKKLEKRTLPPDLDYLSLSGLRLEAREKLQEIRPLNLGQASRVSGVSPADVAVLMVCLKSR